MPLNEDQTKAVDVVLNAYDEFQEYVGNQRYLDERNDNDEEEFFSVGIFGAGGVGKTYTAKTVLKELENKVDWMLPTLVLAPTNKALKVIKNAFDNTIGIDFATIHSAVGLQPDFDEKGKMHFTNNRLKDEPAFSGYKIVMVDEASMVDEKLTGLLIENCKEVNAFPIIMGDQYQHHPVGLDYCPLIKRATYSHTLTKIMRQGGNNPIKDPIQQARDAVINNVKNYDPRWTFDETMKVNIDGKEVGYYVIYDDDKALRQIHRAYCKAYETENFEFAKVLCWKNSTADNLNALIREKLWKSDAKYDFIPGDLLITRSPVIGKVATVSGKLRDTVILHTSAEAMIIGTPVPITLPYQNDLLNTSYRGWKVTVKSIDTGKTVDVLLVSLGDAKRYQDDQEFIRKKCIDAFKHSHGSKAVWTPYFIHLKLFHDLRHAYAINTHLSQGSSYINAFVNSSDISTNTFNTQLRNRTHYVGMSRAVDRSIVF